MNHHNLWHLLVAGALGLVGWVLIAFLLHLLEVLQQVK